MADIFPGSAVAILVPELTPLLPGTNIRCKVQSLPEELIHITLPNREDHIPVLEIGAAIQEVEECVSQSLSKWIRVEALALRTTDQPEVKDLVEQLVHGLACVWVDLPFLIEAEGQVPLQSKARCVDESAANFEVVDPAFAIHDQPPGSLRAVQGDRRISLQKQPYIFGDGIANSLSLQDKMGRTKTLPQQFAVRVIVDCLGAELVQESVSHQ
mmetsp:Transcript_75192/g.121372  ORF Transcript_75192/g.121372 Transcript_75192/m.121372 type:complete len:213 (+) Transcript_75192:909-1547(+)